MLRCGCGASVGGSWVTRRGLICGVPFQCSAELADAAGGLGAWSWVEAGSGVGASAAGVAAVGCRSAAGGSGRAAAAARLTWSGRIRACVGSGSTCR